MTQRSGIPFATQVAGDVYSSFVRLNNVISKNDGMIQTKVSMKISRHILELRTLFMISTKLARHI